MIHTLSFYGSVSGSSRVTLVSSKIAFPYMMRRIRIKFALGHEGKVQHKFFISYDDAAPTSGEPSGANILEQYGSVDYVVGDDDVMVLYDNTYVDAKNTWIKVLAINTDTATHTINVIIEIDDLLERPAEKRMKKMIEDLVKAVALEEEPEIK